MNDIKVFVDNDTIHNPFWEVRLTLAKGSYRKVSTSEAVRVAKAAQSKVDKIVICHGRVPMEVMFRGVSRQGVTIIENSSSNGYRTHIHYGYKTVVEVYDVARRS